MMKIWGDLDHRLSIVERWATMHHLHRQSVAEHIFNVERMAVRIAEQWFDYDFEQLFYVYEWAHHHEDFEALSGDFPSMVKPYFDETAFEIEHSDVVARRQPYNAEVKHIVKLADMLDCWWYLCVEKALGNTYCDNHTEHEPGRIRQFVRDTWPNRPDLETSTQGLLVSMEAEISIRHSRRGR